LTDLLIWLTEFGLEKYASVFAEHEIDFDVLRLLTEEDVRELSLPLGPRRKLLAGLSRLRKDAIPQLRDEAERRQLTVMFVDLADSTALATHLDPEAMREVLRAYQNAVAGEVTRVGGHVAKLMGDGVLVYFGWPRAHEDDAERAVRAGLAATEVVGQMTSPSGAKLACRAGIATGLVVVGDLIGEGGAQEHAVVGATPNLAARLQAEAGDGQVVVAAATRRLLGPGFIVEALDERPLKGHDGSVPLFQVLGEAPHEHRLTGDATGPMLGRKTELAVLQDAWQRARTGVGQAVLLTGEAGIGKSRLLRCLVEEIAGDDPAQEFFQCSPLHSDSPIWPIAQRLMVDAGIVTNDDASGRDAKLTRMVARWGADHQQIDRILRPLFGIGVRPDLAAGRSPQEHRRETIDTLTGRLLAAAGSGPALIIFEDVQWADRVTLDLLRNLIGAIADAPVLLIMTARDERGLNFRATPTLSRLSLARLDYSSAAALLAETAGTRRLATRVVETILARSDGIPLFVEEITKAVIEAPDGENSVPMTLRDSLIARLDASPAMKSVAQVAACIGREFEGTLLQQSADLASATLSDGLHRLKEAGLVIAETDGRYRFRHALVCDIAYETLLTPRRKSLHQRIAQTLEAMPGGRADNEPEVLARHWFGAGQNERAKEYWLRAHHRAAHWQDQLDALANYLEADGPGAASIDEINAPRMLH
jgi:class 3 adenylate cyclase/DNA-binding transcriptional ArsR family regulator